MFCRGAQDVTRGVKATSETDLPDTRVADQRLRYLGATQYNVYNAFG